MVRGLAPNLVTLVRFPEAAMFFIRRQLFSLCCALCAFARSAECAFVL